MYLPHLVHDIEFHVGSGKRKKTKLPTYCAEKFSTYGTQEAHAMDLYG